jgi:hypothetical protein
VLALNCGNGGARDGQAAEGDAAEVIGRRSGARRAQEGEREE